MKYELSGEWKIESQGSKGSDQKVKIYSVTGYKQCSPGNIAVKHLLEGMEYSRISQMKQK